MPLPKPIVVTPAATKTYQYQTSESDYQFVQDFNKIVASSYSSSTQPEQLFTLSLNHPQDFVIRNTSNSGNADVTIGSNKTPCFKMVRKGGVVLAMNTEFVIMNMKKEPLLTMKESRYGGGTTMTLCLYNPLLPQDQDPVPICRVTRKVCNLTVHDRYEVELLGPLAQHYPNVKCNGHWPHNFTLDDSEGNGETLVSIKKRQMGHKWKLSVSEGQDVLLSIGIACAIDRIGHEVKARKATYVGIGLAIGSIGHKY